MVPVSEIPNPSTVSVFILRCGVSHNLSLQQTKVFIGSLPQGSKPEELRKLFERYGAVTECDIMNRCGFVHMQTEEQAATAIRSLHNSTFNGAVISVERGRIKERGGPGGGRGRGGGGRGGMGERRGGGPVRGGHPGARDAPYMRDARPMGHMRGDMRGPPSGGMHQGMGMRNGGMGGGYDRGADRGMGGGYDDRYGGYGGEDRRGFALMDARDPYAAPAPMYDDRRGYGGAVDDMAGMYADERRAPMYPDEREIMERRPMGRGIPSHMSGGYDRPASRAAPMGNGDMFSRRSPM